MKLLHASSRTRPEPLVFPHGTTLRAALLLNGRGVSPEIARPLLTAFAASCGARVVEQAEYFLDDYRESPLEYRASQTLLSYTLAPDT